jgi:hypothetical protein
VADAEDIGGDGGGIPVGSPLMCVRWMCCCCDRKYDITFIGTITKAGSREGGGVNDHRKNAIKAIQRLKAKYPNLSVFTQDTTVTYENFVSIMRGE